MCSVWNGGASIDRGWAGAIAGAVRGDPVDRVVDLCACRGIPYNASDPV